MTLVCLTSVTLTACASGPTDLVEEPLAESSVIPPLPADLAVPCPDPGVRVGQDARVALAHNRAALKTCINRHGQVVRFYTNVRRATQSD